jgi:hypothetical protein
MRVEVVRVSRRPPWPLWAVLVICVWLALGGTVVWLSARMGRPIYTCLFKRLTGMACPTCGFTRGALCLLHGRIGQAWLYNPLLFSALAVFFAVTVLQGVFARGLRIRLTQTERIIVWVLCIILFLANWAYVALRVG